MRDLETVLQAYIACALWSSTDDVGYPLDDNYGADSISSKAIDAMRADCAGFISDTSGIDSSAWSDESFGHDFWLTRNRHGAGFWDRGHGLAGDKLTAAAHIYGEQALCAGGDDGELYLG